MSEKIGFRTRFATGDGGEVQDVLDNSAFDVEDVSLRPMQPSGVEVEFDVEVGDISGIEDLENRVDSALSRVDSFIGITQVSLNL